MGAYQTFSANHLPIQTRAILRHLKALPYFPLLMLNSANEMYAFIPKTFNCFIQSELVIEGEMEPTVLLKSLSYDWRTDNFWSSLTAVTG